LGIANSPSSLQCPEIDAARISIKKRGRPPIRPAGKGVNILMLDQLRGKFRQENSSFCKCYATDEEIAGQA
jgi:hypothetical protein